MAVDPFHGIGRREGQRAREHLVKTDAGRVEIEIAAGIDRSVHPSGLFRRHVGECARDDFGRIWRLALTRKARRNSEARQPRTAGRRIDKDMCWLDVLVKETPFV
jgi:hypothetical protein